MSLSSKLLESAVEQFMQLPGVGKRTALRYVLFLLKQDSTRLVSFGEILSRLSSDIRYCNTCFNISDHTICEICANEFRDQHTICVVEDIRDVMAIEETQQYRGVYHVLGGLISPMDGIGPTDLNIKSLEERVQQNEIKEVFFALTGTMEGETTVFYVHKKIKNHVANVTTIARGVAFGGDLEYADEFTLGRSIVTRMPYEK